MDESNETHIRRLAAGESLPHDPALVEMLEDLGLGLVAEGDRVRLEQSLELLHPDVIGDALHATTRDVLSQMEVFWSIDSTNTYLLDRADQGIFHGRVCTAERQFAGKGRRGRTWVSPFGKNIYLSVGWEIPRTHPGVGGLSLVVGVAVAEALKELGVSGVGLKWPNDIILDDGKLAGILVEMATPTSDHHRTVIGVGINLLLDAADAREIDQAFSTAGGIIDTGRNILLAEVLNRITAELAVFEREGFAPFADRWQVLDIYAGRAVNITSVLETRSGVNRGVDSAGNLLVETDNGLVSFNAGEVSLRPN